MIKTILFQQFMGHLLKLHYLNVNRQKESISCFLQGQGIPPLSFSLSRPLFLLLLNTRIRESHD